MTFDKEALFNLLPAFDRIRDYELANPAVSNAPLADGPLKGILGLIAEQMATIEGNLDQLYDDQFIETCAEWVVPYIGQLTATRGLVVFPNAPFSQRAQVANTIAYRRRKGTASVIEQLARDVTGWSAQVVEYFQLLATTQYLNHLRPGNQSMASVRGINRLDLINTPFDPFARTADVRNIAPKRGKYNIGNIGIFLWRLSPYSMIRSRACRVDALRYKFDPLGKDIQLFTMPSDEDDISHLAEPINVPMPIRRLMMRANPDQYYGAEKSVLVYVNGVPANNISICNLSDTNDGTGNWVHMPANKIAIDPVLGRIAFPPALPPVNVHVDFHYGFSADMGGGDYDRSKGFIHVTNNIQKVSVPADQPTIAAALASVSNNGVIVADTLIEITDNELYQENIVITIASGKTLEIRGALDHRPTIHLQSTIDVFGDANATCFLNGLLVSGAAIRVPAVNALNVVNHLKLLNIRDCTLVQNAVLIANAPGVELNISKSIVGSIRINDDAQCKIIDSIVDSGDISNIAYADPTSTYGAPLHIENTTVIGRVMVRIMNLASNVIFYAESGMLPPVDAQRLQEGCIRFSYVPPGSRVPNRYRCQPDVPENAMRVRPLFNSLRYGNAAYLQLNEHCAKEIREGGDNGAEMGAFNTLYQPQREANLRTRLNEYLRFGLEAGIFYAT